jgi:large subunit ribosomal protein L24
MTNTYKKDLHVKNGDRVVVIAGKDKGKTGNIKKIDRSKGKVTVEGLNMVTKAQKPMPAAQIQGGLIKVEAPMDSSNVMIVCPACDKPTKAVMKVIDGKKVRVCKKCGEQLDA